jgi:hypothetical protein
MLAGDGARAQEVWATVKLHRCQEMALWDVGHGDIFRVSAREVEAAPTASIVTAFAAAFETTVPWWAGWSASSGKHPSAVLMKLSHYTGEIMSD